MPLQNSRKDSINVQTKAFKEERGSAEGLREWRESGEDAWIIPKTKAWDHPLHTFDRRTFSEKDSDRLRICDLLCTYHSDEIHLP